jgi:hypothetical protein
VARIVSHKITGCRAEDGTSLGNKIMPPTKMILAVSAAPWLWTPFCQYELFVVKKKKKKSHGETKFLGSHILMAKIKS